MGGFQDLESMQWRWFWLEGCVNFLKWVVNGNCNDSPTPCTPLNSDALLLLYPGIFSAKFLSCGVTYPCHFRLSFATKSCPLPGSMLKTPFSITPSSIEDTQFRPGCFRAATQTMCTVLDLYCLP